ncbi:MAG: GDP-mannose 4,6-dehydratase [Cryobacterium sp.]|nr:GDP-mannose 4,6-dehydratase [Oligoflexia bacterium]
MTEVNLSGKHILITGGAGFIGSHLVDRLLERGAYVTALDNFVTGRRENLTLAMKNQNFRLVEADVSANWPKEKIEFLSQGLHGLFHFACPASPVDFDRIPFEILAVDSIGTFRSVDLALEYGSRYLIASTSEVYGDPLVHPQTEDYFGNVNPIGPRACYDEAKRFGEALVSTAIRGVGTWNGRADYGSRANASGKKGLNGGIVRIFNTYGPRMRPDDGRVVPELCMQALQEKPLTIHGDGMQTRSFCYVDDLVEGILRYFDSDLSAPTNIGNPSERTIREFAEAVREQARIDGFQEMPIQSLPGRQDDPKKRCPDISVARMKLGWEPKVGLTEGLSRTFKYFHSEMEKRN